jgi:hypothetical protein
MKIVCLTVGLLVAYVHATGAQLLDGWQALKDYRAERALNVFDAAQDHPEAATAREARFGRAVALLDDQPVTSAKLDEAHRLFSELAGSGTDDFAQGARFFLGRIAQHHATQSDPAEARRQYRQLLNEHVDSIWAQTAISRLALLEIYALNLEQPPADRIAATEDLLGYTRTPTAESELRYVIANAIFFYRLPSTSALQHLLAAEHLGRLGWNERRDVLVQIAELSRRAGNARQAAEYYRKFLAENPRDQRHYIVQERLAALAKEPANVAP